MDNNARKKFIYSEIQKNEQNVKKVSYVPNVSGSVFFSGLPNNAQLFIYDLRGRIVRHLPAGTTIWDGMNDAGASVSGGHYITTINTEGTQSALKILKK